MLSKPETPLAVLVAVVVLGRHGEVFRRGHLGLVEGGCPECRADEAADDALQVDLHGLVVEVVAQDVGAADDVLLGAFADGGVFGAVQPEGAGEVLGEGAVGVLGR